MLSMLPQISLLLAFVAATGNGFTPTPPSVGLPTRSAQNGITIMNTPNSGRLHMTSTASASNSDNTMSDDNNIMHIEEDSWFIDWASSNKMELNPKLSIREPLEDERGKGGVSVSTSAKDIKALEVIARIPRELIITDVDAPPRAMEAAAQAKNFSWATDLTAAALVDLHPLAAADDDDDDDETMSSPTQEWIQQWHAGGWATDGADLGPDDANFGPKDVTGSLLATGSDNDHNIYAKFRIPCHPVLLRAAIGLKVLTGCTEEEARDILTARGRMYRSMRDALQALVLESSPREKGSNREKKCWDVADTLSRVLSRATFLELEEEESSYAIVPLHDRLAHSKKENSKLVSSGDAVLLVATRDIPAGEEITRNYAAAPKLDQDESKGSLRLLLQFGLPPSSWER